MDIIEFEGCAIKSISAHISQKSICAIHLMRRTEAVQKTDSFA
jgi:hypothetical protein